MNPFGPPAPEPLVTFHPHPDGAQQVGCPACGSTDELVVYVPSFTVHRVDCWQIPGITDPEASVVETMLPPADDPIDGMTRVRCNRCHWSYQGPHPLTKLAVPR